MRRAATIAAIVGALTGWLGAFRAERAIVANTGGAGHLSPWVIVPLALGAISVLAVRSRSIGFVWSVVGGVWAFVVLGAWSLGLFFGWEALALLLAAVLHLVAIEAGWKAVRALLWFVLGGSALCVLILARDAVQSMAPGVRVTHAPAVVFGAWIGTAAVALILVSYAPSIFRQQRSRRQRRTS
jgi:hypothetical protein